MGEGIERSPSPRQHITHQQYRVAEYGETRTQWSRSIELSSFPPSNGVGEVLALSAVDHSSGSDHTPLLSEVNVNVGSKLWIQHAHHRPSLGIYLRECGEDICGGEASTAAFHHSMPIPALQVGYRRSHCGEVGQRLTPVRESPASEVGFASNWATMLPNVHLSKISPSLGA